MHENYRPTSAPLVETTSQKPRSSVVAVLLGGLVVDWGGTLAVTTVVGLLWTLIVVLNTDDTDGAEALATFVPFRLTLLALGSLMSVLGGYVAAAWARRLPLRHGLFAGLATVSFSVVFALGRGELPDPLNLATPPLALLGGYLRSRRQR